MKNYQNGYNRPRTFAESQPIEYFAERNRKRIEAETEAAKLKPYSLDIRTDAIMIAAASADMYGDALPDLLPVPPNNVVELRPIPQPAPGAAEVGSVAVAATKTAS